MKWRTDELMALLVDTNVLLGVFQDDPVIYAELFPNCDSVAALAPPGPLIMYTIGVWN